jgi:hypothetical protein
MGTTQEVHGANAGASSTDIVPCLGCNSGARHHFRVGTMRPDVFVPLDGFRGLDIDMRVYIKDSSNPAPNIDMRVYI